MINDTIFKNESASDYLTHPETFVIVNCALNAILMLITILGNSLVIVAVLKTPSIRSPSITLFCGLAVSDLLVGLVGQPLYIVKELKVRDLLLKFIWYFTTYCSCGVSLCTVTIITLDRFAALHYHMRYATLVTTARVVYTLVIAWLIIFLSFGIFFLDKSVNFLIASVFIAICLSISSFCYIRIFHIVKRHQKQIKTQHQIVQSSNDANNLNMMRLKKSSMNTFVFYIVLILCYFPMFVLMILYGKKKSLTHEQWTPELSFSGTAVFVNSSINPLLYCWRLTELRAAIIKITRKILCRQTDQE